MGRYNLKNDHRSKKYEHDELDVTRLSRELIRPKSTIVRCVEGNFSQ